MSKKPAFSGLGNVTGIHGLGAQLAEVMGKATLLTLPISQIQVLPGHNPRGRYDKAAFSEERLQNLAASIKRDGVKSPLWVRPLPDGSYGLVAGERRYRAAQIAGLEEVPALIHNVDEREALRLALLENGQREDLSIMEETYIGFVLMQERTGLSRDELIAHLNQVRKRREEDVYELGNLLAQTFNTSLSAWAQKRAKVFDLTEEEAAAVFEDKIDFEVAIALTRLPKSHTRSEIFQQAVEEGLNATQVRRLIDKVLGAQATPLESAANDLKKVLPRLSRLEGEKAEEAQRLLSRLRELLR